MSMGIAGASALLSCGSSATAGLERRHDGGRSPALVAASRDVVILLCGFGVLAGALSLMRTAPRKARGADESEQVGAA